MRFQAHSDRGLSADRAVKEEVWIIHRDDAPLRRARGHYVRTNCLAMGKSHWPSAPIAAPYSAGLAEGQVSAAQHRLKVAKGLQPQRGALRPEPGRPNFPYCASKVVCELSPRSMAKAVLSRHAAQLHKGDERIARGLLPCHCSACNVY